MNVKAFSILFFVLIAFVIGLNIMVANATVIKDGIVFWSNKTAELWYSPGNKIHIDNNTYITDYNLKEGWVKVHTEIPTLLAFCDPFSGKWIKKFIKKGETNVTLPFKPKSYGGLRLLIISSPWGFGFIREKESPLEWYDYPVVILLSELAKFSWERAFYSACLLVFGLALSRYLKKEKMIVSFGKHVPIILLVCIVILAVLEMTYTTETVKINQTVKEIPHLVFSTYRMKEMWNYYYCGFFIFGYIFGYILWRTNKLYVVHAGYSEPLKLNIYPYDAEKKVIRDFDGKLAEIKFKNDFRQFINLDLNGYNVQGILAVNIQDVVKEKEKIEVNKKYALAGFFGFLALSIVADYLNVFKIDLAYSLFFACIIAIVTNLDAIRSWLGYYVEKVEVIECSQLNEDNYVKMLKEAEIEHILRDYEKLLRDYTKEKILMPRRVVKHLLGMIREVRKVKVEDIVKRREENGEDKD